MTREPLGVLLTGASGFLGHYLLAELLNLPNVRCHVLLRPPLSESCARLEQLLAEIGLDLPSLISERRVVPLEGELPNLLNRTDVADVDLILHAAGNTTFHGNGSGEPANTNINGTRAMLSLATDAGVRRFVYVSTAYVCGDGTGHRPEAYCTTMPPLRNDYERSKWEAEKLVWKWGNRNGIATICRPSILFGHSRTGRASAMKGLYLVARATEILARAMNGSAKSDRHQIPLRVLGRSDATCNIVPIDWAAQQIARIALEPAAESSVHHVTNPHPPTHQNVKAWLEEYFDIAGGQFSDASWPLDDPNHYEDLFYSLGNICLDYFRHGLTFESRCAAELPPGKRLIDGESFARCIKFAQATNWCRNSNESNDLRPPGCGIDPKWYFERFLPKAVPRSVVSQVEVFTATVKYTITGPVGGSWICRFENGQLMETQTAPGALQPEFEYRLSYEALIDVVGCHKPLQDVFFHGSAEMFGDVEHALKMVPIIAEFLKQFPVTCNRDSGNGDSAKGNSANGDSAAASCMGEAC
jgi:thioester reductase-like protein